MKTAALTGLTIVVALLAANADALSGTRGASAVVKICAEPDSPAIDLNIVCAMIKSSAVAGKAYSRIGGPTNGAGFIKTIRLLSSVMTRPSKDQGEENARESALLEAELQNMSGLIEVMEHEAADLKDRHMSSRRGVDRESILRRLTTVYSKLQELNNRCIEIRFEQAELTGNSAAQAGDSDALSELIFEIGVAIPEDGPPVAEEFLGGIISNLRRVLEDMTKRQRQQLTDERAVAIAQQKAAQKRLDEITKKAEVPAEEPPIEEDSADIAVYKQLNQTVDLSALSPDMTFADALDVIKNSVHPPLKMIVNWRDLLNTADIDQATAINMDPISGVKLANALDSLLQIVGGGFVELRYVIDGGVITIATTGSLPHTMIPRVYNVPGGVVTADDFIDAIQCVEPDSWYDHGGEGTITIYGRSCLIVNQFPEVHRKVYEFIQTLEAQPAAPQVAVPQVSVEVLLDRKQELMRDKQKLETDNARLSARRKAIKLQLGDIRSKLESKLAEDVVMKELQGILDMAIKQQESVERRLNSGRAEMAEVTKIAEQIARTKIEMAQRREQLAKEAGGDLLMRFSDELATVAVDFAENQAMLEVTDRQIAEVDSQLAAAAADEPYKSELRLAEEALQAATARVNEIQSRLESSRPPTVTIIGVD